MIALPKLLLIALIAVAAWYALRWLNKPEGAVQRRASRPAARARIDAEELVPCGVCGTYLTLTARGCGKPGCPRPA